MKISEDHPLNLIGDNLHFSSGRSRAESNKALCGNRLSRCLPVKIL